MINYSISKHQQLSELNGKDVYILWKESNSKHGMGIRGIFQGTRKECEEKLKEIRRRDNNE